jgi:DNA repair photolyase
MKECETVQYIKRKTLLYKTSVEYGDFSLNHVLGCSHGCLYPCYAMMMAKRFGRVKSYEEWIHPRIVENALELLRKEIPKYQDKIKCSKYPDRHEYYNQLSQQVIDFCRQNNMEYHIKKGTISNSVFAL